MHNSTSIVICCMYYSRLLISWDNKSPKEKGMRARLRVVELQIIHLTSAHSTLNFWT